MRGSTAKKPSGAELTALGSRERKISGNRTAACTECGKVFQASRSNHITCSQACRKARERRRAKGDMRHALPGASDAQVALEEATLLGLDRLPDTVQAVLAEEVRPIVREELLKGNVLDSIADMCNMLPLAQAAIKDDLTAREPVFHDNWEPVLDADGNQLYRIDYDRRAKAVTYVLKYTLGQAALAPQPLQPENQGIVVNFTGLGRPESIDAEIIEEAELIQLEEGVTRRCDVCADIKPRDEFVGNSPRCMECHEEVRIRAAEALAAKESQQLR